MPPWILALGLPLVLAMALARRFGNQPPAMLAIDPLTGQALSFNSEQPGLFQQAWDYVMPLQASQGALDFIRQTESLSLVPYQGKADRAGVYTIGYGHKIVPGDPYWPLGEITAISADEADSLFRFDVDNAADTVRRLVAVPLAQGQFDSLVSFVMNLGSGNFAGSTLLRKLNAGDYVGASQEFQRWVYSNGRIQPGLVTRRVAEAATFNDSAIG